MDTTAFNHTLAETLGREFDVFKAMSPRDLYWESIGAQKRFRDLDALKAYGNGLLHSFYVHACHWQANIEALTDRVDSFIVYLSSITPSVLWEIDTPKAKGRAADTTDESGWALAVYAGLQKALLDRGHRRRRRPRPQRLRWRGSSQRLARS